MHRDEFIEWLIAVVLVLCLMSIAKGLVCLYPLPMHW